MLLNDHLTFLCCSDFSIFLAISHIAELIDELQLESAFCFRDQVVFAISVFLMVGFIFKHLFHQICIRFSRVKICLFFFSISKKKILYIFFKSYKLNNFINIKSVLEIRILFYIVIKMVKKS